MRDSAHELTFVTDDAVVVLLLRVFPLFVSAQVTRRGERLKPETRSIERDCVTLCFPFSCVSAGYTVVND